MPQEIAIIGGGASACLLLAHLARHQLPPASKIDIYERHYPNALGIAYHTSNPNHLLNVRASHMSGLADIPEHFANWAAPQGYAPTAFVPRFLYGKYLQSIRLESEALLAAQNCQVAWIRADALSSQRLESGYFSLQTAMAEKNYHQIVLATGNTLPLAPRMPAGLSLGPQNGYWPDPWRLNESVLTAKDVAIIGAGLSAVDAVLSLKHLNYTGPITMLSRRGLLPKIHAAPHPPLTIAWPKIASPRQMLRCVRQEMRKAENLGVPWQAVLDSLRPRTNEYWQSWNENQRQQFHRHLYTVWGVHRHRMAPEIATQLQPLFASGQLTLRAARVQDLRPVAGGVVVEMAGATAAQFGGVINALGYRYAEPERNFAFSARLGPACFGELFETTAIPEIRAQAALLAEKIAVELKKS